MLFLGGTPTFKHLRFFPLGFPLVFPLECGLTPFYGSGAEGPKEPEKGVEWRSHSTPFLVLWPPVARTKRVWGALRIRVHALRGVEYNKLYPPTMTSSSSFEMVDFTC